MIETGPNPTYAERPNAQRNGWKTLRIEYPYVHPLGMFRVRRDHAIWPDGVERPYAFIEVGPAIIIVPVTASGEVVLIREFRYTVDAWMWELPAGGTHDFYGDDLADLERSELREEIGGEAEMLEFVGLYRSGVGLIDQQFHIYLATDVRLGDNHLEPGELIEIHPTPIDRALAMVHSGEIIDGPSAFALLRCEPRLRAMR